jgi:hypothetical protein
MRASARILYSWLPIVWVLLLLGAPATGPDPFAAGDFDGDGRLEYSDLGNELSPADNWFSFSAACVVDDLTPGPPADANQPVPPVCALTPYPTFHAPALLTSRLSAHTVVLPDASQVLASLGPRPPPRSL